MSKRDLIYVKVQRHAQKRRKKGITARLRARRKAAESRASKPVYAAVDIRDGRKCRFTGKFWGDQIHRNHIEKRRRGNTTVENVISLGPDIHLEQIHGPKPTIRLKGNANIIGGVEVWERVLHIDITTGQWVVGWEHTKNI